MDVDLLLHPFEVTIQRLVDDGGREFVLLILERAYIFQSRELIEWVHLELYGEVLGIHTTIRSRCRMHPYRLLKVCRQHTLDSLLNTLECPAGVVEFCLQLEPDVGHASEGQVS